MWKKGKPKNEGIYFMCFLDPYGSGIAVYSEAIVTAADTVMSQGQEIKTVYGWYDYTPCPFAPANPPSANQALKDRLKRS